jgi:hypothetical protein
MFDRGGRSLSELYGEYVRIDRDRAGGIGFRPGDLDVIFEPFDAVDE